MNITLQQLEFFLVLLIRITGFIFAAPFFNLKNVPTRIKIGFSLAFALILYSVMPYEPLEYSGVIGYALIIFGELLAGLILGFVANICYQILAMAGQMIDFDIGYSMVNEFDPVTNGQVTVSGNMYSYAVMLMLMVTYMHHFLLEALIDSYKLVPLGGVEVNPLIYTVSVRFITDYFILAFRIVLPVFASMLLVNTVLAILAKVAPQMNMFVIGMQLKVLIGLAVILITIRLIPFVSELIFDEMMELIRDAVSYL